MGLTQARAELAELPLFAGAQVAGDNGHGQASGAVYFVAFRDSGCEMIPSSTGGRLLVYPTLDAARADSGALGVGAAMRWPRVEELCKRHGLALPATTGNREEVRT